MVVAWINFAVLLTCAFAILYLYEHSVCPAAREKLTGDPESYARCGWLRKVSAIPMAISTACFFLYRFFPLPVPLPVDFPWPWWFSIALSMLLMIPAGWVLMKGVKAAGKESMSPSKEHTLYGGIYERIRHPQFYEVVYWWGFALLLHSPFLFLFSFVYLPIWLLMVQAEERDLLIRYGEDYVEYYRRTGAFFPKSQVSQ